MFYRFHALLLSAALVVSACGQLPTAPSAVAPGAPVGETAQTPPAVPSAIIPTPPQALGATRFLGFGDSITCGVPSSFDALVQIDCQPVAGGGYPERLRGMLATYNASQSFAVTNRGLPGETAAAGEMRLTSELSELMGVSVPLANRPQALLLLEGINDMNSGVSAARAASSVSQMVQTARLFNLAVLVATMPQTYRSVDSMGVVRENSAQLIVPFNAEVRRLVSGQQNVRVVDLFAAFGTNRTLMGADGLHPSPAGYDVMAQQFHAAILQHFPVRGSLQ